MSGNTHKVRSLGHRSVALIQSSKKKIKKGGGEYRIRLEMFSTIHRSLLCSRKYPIGARPKFNETDKTLKILKKVAKLIFPIFVARITTFLRS